MIEKINKGLEIYHVHSSTCGHESIIHNGHVDYIVQGRLHHPHGKHCDDHGPIVVLFEDEKGHLIQKNEGNVLHGEET